MLKMNQHTKHFSLSYFLILLFFPIYLGASCNSVNTPTLPPPLPSPQTIQKAKSAHLLGPGDVVEIRVYREAELSGLYHVDPSGYFTFPLIGTVKANQGGIHELTQEITTRLKAKYIRDPQVTVILKVSKSKKIFVLGMVKKPGSFVYESQMTVVQAIALAGGFQTLASKDLVLIREAQSGNEQKFRIPFKEISQGKAPNSPLEPGDILFVPESWY